MHLNKSSILIYIIVLLSHCRSNPENVQSTKVDSTFQFNSLYAVHQKLGEPLPGEWRESHPEISQSVESYIRQYDSIPDRGSRTIYIQPIGRFSDEQKSTLETTKNFLRAFYGVRIKILDAFEDHIIPDSARRIHMDTEQLQTRFILFEMLKPKIPSDALAMFAVTEKDLYPREGWNYVFGQASLKDKVGVASMYRLNGENSQELFTRRLMKTVAHEIGHIAHIKHCQKYACLMNGSNNLPEADRRPLWLCPSCLYKLTWFLGYDPEERLLKMEDFYEIHDMPGEAAFIKESLEIGTKSH